LQDLASHHTSYQIDTRSRSLGRISDCGAGDAVTPPLAILLKAPRLGMVKTRLAAEVGDRHALRLYRVMAGRVLAAVRTAGLEAIIWFTPPEALAEMEFWLGDSWEFRPQPSGDLGARLAAAARVVPRGHPWMAVCADCPSITAAVLRQACAHLERAGVVIGPTIDGGYYLVGGRTPLPDIFTAMPWGSDRVLAETRVRLARISAVWHELPVLRDVDTAADARAERLLT
jgi:rSAM/selenodomain-associated transferase 1